mmetsp:Transcript_12227/g.29188  ORF Transcript_12227/g.29188 Transcript_12227/m.29188 type:complete len:567 (-) Transcript_12227:214-1914(-)
MRFLSSKVPRMGWIPGTIALLAVLIHVAGGFSVQPYTGVSSPLHGRRTAAKSAHLVQRIHRNVPDLSMQSGDDPAHVQTSAHRPSSDDEPSPSRPLDPSVIAALEAPISDLSPAVQQLLEQEIENIAEEQKKEEEVQKVQEQLAAERANPQDQGSQPRNAPPMTTSAAIDNIVTDMKASSFWQEFIVPKVGIPALALFVVAPIVSLVATSKYTSVLAHDLFEFHPILNILSDQKSRDFVIPLTYVLGGYVLSNYLAFAAQRRLLDSWMVDETTALFLEGFVKWGSLTIAASVVLRALGFQTAGLDTLLASSGVAVAFASQQLLKNLASGFMILLFRPFQVGDRIQAGPITGTVMSVGILETLLLTDGGIRIWYANASIKETYLQNLSQHGMRRIEVGITVSVKADVAETRKALEDAIEPFQDLWKEGVGATAGLGPLPPGLPQLKEPTAKPRLSVGQAIVNKYRGAIKALDLNGDGKVTASEIVKAVSGDVIKKIAGDTHPNKPQVAQAKRGYVYCNAGTDIGIQWFAHLWVPAAKHDIQYVLVVESIVQTLQERGIDVAVRARSG